MSATPVIVHGMLKPDGTLVLDERPTLPPGRVQVILQPNPSKSPEDAWSVLQRIHREREARGVTPRTKDEIDAEIQSMRDEWEARQRALEQLQEEGRRARE